MASGYNNDPSQRARVPITPRTVLLLSFPCFATLDLVRRFELRLVASTITQIIRDSEYGIDDEMKYLRSLANEAVTTLHDIDETPCGSDGNEDVY